jgi:hypothetical protein
VKSITNLFYETNSAIKNESILLMKTPLLAMAAAKKEKAANGDL